MKELRAERRGEEVAGQDVTGNAAVPADREDQKVRSELEEELTADPAWDAGVGPVPNDRERDEVSCSDDDGGADSETLGAEGSPVGGVLDVRAREDTAVVGEHRCTDLKA